MDLASLQWVQSDIEQSLRQAQSSLENFADDASQGASLRDCADTLHGVRGVLEMLEVYGVSLLFDELEGVIEGLMAGAIRRRDDACEVLMQGIAQVPDYLDYIGRGNRDNAVLLMPLLNDARSVRGMPLLSENVLFAPEVFVALPISERPVALAGDEFVAYVRKLRPYFQRGLVGWYRGNELQTSFELMDAVVLHVEKLVGSAPCARLWWITRAVVQALKADALEHAVALKLLMGQVDRQLKNFCDVGAAACAEQPPTELLKNLLYYVAQVDMDTRRVSAVRAAFSLGDLVSVDADTRGNHPLFGPNLDTFSSVSVAVKESLASIKDRLDTFSRKEQRDVAELVPLVGLLQAMADTLGLLGLGIPRRSILEQREVLEELIEHQRAPTNDQLMDIAGALLGIDSTMDALSEHGVDKTIADDERAAELEPADSHLTGIEYLQLVTSVIGEIKTDLAIVKDAIATFLEDPAQRHRLEDVPRRVEQVVGGLRMLYLEPAAELMERWMKFVDQQLLQASSAPSGDVLELLAEGVESLEFYLESVASARADADMRLYDAGSRIRALPVRDVEDEVADSPDRPVGQSTEDGGPLAGSVFEGAVPTQMLATDDDLDALSVRMASFNEPDAATPPELPTVDAAATGADTLVQAARALEAEAGTVNEVVAQAASPDEPLAHEAGADFGAGLEGEAPLSEAVAAAEPDEDEPFELEIGSEAETVVNVSLPPAIARSLADASSALNRMEGDAQDEGREVAARDDSLDREIVEIFLEEAHEVLGELGETWLRWSRELDDHAALAEVRRSFHTLKGSGRMAGAMALGDLCWAIENMMNRIIDGVIGATPDIVALVGEAFESMPALLSELNGGGPSRVDIAGMAARAEALAEASATQSSNYADRAIQESTVAHSSGQHFESDIDAVAPDDDDAGAQTVVTEPTGAEILEFPLRREPPVSDPVVLAPVVALFRDEASAHLDHIEGLVNGSADNNQRAATHYIRPVHTIVGGARSAGLDHVAGAGSALEEYLSMLAQTHQPVNDAGVEVIRDTVAWIRGCIARLPEGDDTDTASASALASKAKQLTAQAAVGLGVRDNTVSDVEGMTLERAELRDTFVEEAAEIMDLYESVVERWRAGGGNMVLLADLLRALHTLKGGARMVHASEIGDLSHEFENVVTAVSEHRLPFSDDLFELVEHVQERVADLVDCMVAHQPVPDTADVHARIQTLLGEASDEPQADLIAAFAAQSPHATAAGDSQAFGAGTTDQPFDFSFAIGAADDDTAAKFGDDEREPPAQELADESEVASQAASAEVLESVAAGAAQSQAADADEPVLVERGERIQVDAALLDHLVGFAGEISISQSRIELQVGAFRHNLEEMNQTVLRLREQLRRLELETESQIIYRHERETKEVDNTDFDPLELDRFSRMQELSRGLAESVGDLSNIQDMLVDLTRESETILVQQSRTNTDLQHGLMQTRMLPVGRLLPRFRRIVRQTARELGKQIRLEVQGDQIRIDRAILNRMVAPLEHILRNAVDHGVEAPEARESNHKDGEGIVCLRVARDGPEVVIHIDDDGQGVALDAVRSRALQRELLQPGAELSDDDLLQLIFEPGFSTRGSVTQISGRGVGLNVVQNEVKQLGGSVRAESTDGSGTSFVIRLPLTLAINQALMVAVGAEDLGLPLSNVDAVVRMPAKQARELEAQAAPIYEHAGLRYPYVYLGASLSISEPSYHQDRYPVVLIRAGDNRMAVRVDELRGRHEVVVKSVGPMLSAIRWVSGATIMGDGRVVLILDAPTLVRMATALRRPVPVPIAQTADGQGRVVMVVDDSITVRKVTGRFLQRNGMEVITAKDGLEALAMLQDQIPDVMLLDVEMPRMDGFELATTIRNDPRMNALPIIMITSRTGQKHTERARQIGIDRYLGKPYHEGELLDNINALLMESHRARV